MAPTIITRAFKLLLLAAAGVIIVATYIINESYSTCQDEATQSALKTLISLASMLAAICMVFGLSDEGCGLLSQQGTFNIILQVIIFTIALSIAIHTLMVIKTLPCYTAKLESMVSALYITAFVISGILGLYLLTRFGKSVSVEAPSLVEDSVNP